MTFATETYTDALEAQQTLGRLLEALVRVSGRQTESLTPDDFLTLLDHKQRLLDAVSARAPLTLFAQAERVEWALQRAGQGEQAETLRAAAQENLNRFATLQAREAAAREIWQQRRDQLREALTAFSHTQTARRRYTPAPAAAPRFLNASL